MVSNQKAIADLIKSISGQANILSIPRIYVTITGGDHRAALLLSQSVYWSDKTKRADGYFFKTYAEWEEETGLSTHQVRRAATALQGLTEGLFSMKLVKANGAPTIHYRVDIGILTNLIIEFLDNAETAQSDNAESAKSDNAETAQSINRDYTKTTTKTTGKRKAAKQPPPADPPPTSKQPTEQQAMFQALADATMMDMKLNAGRLGKAAKKLIEAGYTPEQVTALYLPGCYWYQRDWRGLRGDPPKPEQVGETIKALMDPSFQDARTNGHHKQTAFERNMAGLAELARQEGINES